MFIENTPALSHQQTQHTPKPMKNILFSVLIAIFFAIIAVSNASAQSLNIVCFEQVDNIETTKVNTTISIHSPTIYTLWHSIDLVNWVRVPAGHELTKRVIDEGDGQVSYNIEKRNAAEFFRLAPFYETLHLNRRLTLGMSGDDVADLQTFLQQKGYLYIPVTATKGYFGSTTKAGVAAYQVARGISPAAGDVGPLTRMVMMADN